MPQIIVISLVAEFINLYQSMDEHSQKPSKGETMNVSNVKKSPNNKRERARQFLRVSRCRGCVKNANPRSIDINKNCIDDVYQLSCVKVISGIIVPVLHNESNPTARGRVKICNLQSGSKPGRYRLGCQHPVKSVLFWIAFFFEKGSRGHESSLQPFG